MFTNPFRWWVNPCTCAIITTIITLAIAKIRNAYTVREFKNLKKQSYLKKRKISEIAGLFYYDFNTGIFNIALYYIYIIELYICDWKGGDTCLGCPILFFRWMNIYKILILNRLRYWVKQSQLLYAPRMMPTFHIPNKLWQWIANQESSPSTDHHDSYKNLGPNVVLCNGGPILSDILMATSALAIN